MTNGSPKLEKDFNFVKWFLSVGTIAIAGFTAFLFNQTINNQTHIREILIEVKNIKVQDNVLSDNLHDLVRRFESLSTDPIHGWGQRWSRAEAARENQQQDIAIERFQSGLDTMRDHYAEIRIAMSKLQAEYQSVHNQVRNHMGLPAHQVAGNSLILLRTQVENLIKKLDEKDHDHSHLPQEDDVN